MTVTRGSKIGLHSVTGHKVMDLVGKAKARGARWVMVKGLGGGLAVAVKAIDEAILTLTRFHADGTDQAGGVETWSLQTMAENARLLVASALGRLSKEERDASDWIEILNEADPPGVDGWLAFGLYCREIIKAANAVGLKVAIPAINYGTPEWDEMVAFVGADLFRLMAEGGHILTVHEGVEPFSDDPLGFGRIPGAPAVSGAGPTSYRYRYLAHAAKLSGQPMPFIVVSEFYAGAGYKPERQAEQWQRHAVYDREIAKDWYVLAALGFTVDPFEGTVWELQDYTPLYSGLILDYIVFEKDRVNAAKPAALVEPRARGFDVNGRYQPPGEMHFDEWAALGFCFGFYSVLIGTTLQAGAEELQRLMYEAGYLTGPYIALHEGAPMVDQVRKYLGLRHPDDTLPDMFDFERDGLTEAMLDTACNYHDEHSHRELIIYTRYGFWTEKVPKSRRSRYSRYEIIIAAYPFDKPDTDANGNPIVQPMDPVSIALRSTPPMTMAPVPDPFLEPWAHQHTGHGTAEPYKKFMDMQVSRWTKSELFAKYPRKQRGDADVPITQEELAEIEKHLAAAATIVRKYRMETPAPPGDWWLEKTPPYKLATTGRTIRLYNSGGMARTEPPLTRTLPSPGAAAADAWDVWERRVDLLRVTNWQDGRDWWVRAIDVTPAQ